MPSEAPATVPGAKPQPPAPPAGSSADGSPSNGSEEHPANLSDEDLKAKLAQMRKPQAQPPDGKVPETPAKPGQAPEDQKDPAVLQRMVRDQNQHIGHLNQQLGELRSMIRELQQKPNPAAAPGATPEPVNVEEFFKDPAGQVTKLVDEELAKRDAKKTETEKAEKEAAQNCFKAVTAALPEGVTDMDVMPFIFAGMLADGVSEEQVKEFARNPFRYKKTAVLNLVKRGLAEFELHRVKNPPQPTKPGTPPARKPAAVPTSMSASQGHSSGGPARSLATQAQLAEMSDAELAEYKRQFKR